MMCITIHCKICRDIIPGASLRRSICDNPECRRINHNKNIVASRIRTNYKQPYRSPKKRYYKLHRIPKFCKICGKELPYGSNCKYYCKKPADCAKIGKRRNWVARGRKG